MEKEGGQNTKLFNRAPTSGAPEVGARLSLVFIDYFALTPYYVCCGLLYMSFPHTQLIVSAVKRVHYKNSEYIPRSTIEH